MIEFRHLEIFRGVMYTGSFTKTAKQLRTSQPTVSRMIAELQEKVGFRLFVREKGGMVPTSEALDFFKVVDQSFLSIDTLVREAESIAGKRTESLRVLSLPALAWSFLPEVVASFQQKRANVKVSIEVQRSEAIAGWSATEYFDVGFSMLPIHRHGVSVQTFRETDGVCMMPEAHALAKLEVIGLKDLEAVEFISGGPFSYGTNRQRLEQLLRDAGVSVIAKAETPITAIACELVARGVGVAIVDPLFALSYRSRGVVTRPFTPAVSFQYGVFTPHTSVPHALAADFINEAFSVQQRLEQVCQFPN